jgi:hypothetical protein
VGGERLDRNFSGPYVAGAEHDQQQSDQSLDVHCLSPFVTNKKNTQKSRRPVAAPSQLYLQAASLTLRRRRKTIVAWFTRFDP